MQKDISEVGISSITLSELEYGVQKSSQRERNKLALAQFVAPLAILPYDNHIAPIYGRVRALLEQEGITIGSLDMLIESQQEDEYEALELFEKYADQEVSFTDCVSFVLMRVKNLRTVFSFDTHFERAGFQLWG